MSSLDFLSNEDGDKLGKAIRLSEDFNKKTAMLIHGLLFDVEYEKYFNAGRRWESRLSVREKDVVVMKLKGLSFYAIADILSLHPSSIKTYWRRAMGKKPSI